MNRILNVIDRLPLLPLLAGAVLLGSAPFVPEPHLVEKLRLLLAGQLVRPLDIFDLMLHGALPVLLVARLFRLMAVRDGT